MEICQELLYVHIFHYDHVLLQVIGKQLGMVDLPLSLTATGQRKMIHNTGGRTLTLGGVSVQQLLPW